MKVKSKKLNELNENSFGVSTNQRIMLMTVVTNNRL